MQEAAALEPQTRETNNVGKKGIHNEYSCRGFFFRKMDLKADCHLYDAVLKIYTS